MPPLYERTHIIVGDEGIGRLRAARVLVVGLGGVGSYCAEALARMGIGRLSIADHDTISASNANRQLHAMNSTLGRKKVEVMAERIRDINPAIDLNPIADFLREEEMATELATGYDYVVDAIDSLNSKVALVALAYGMGIPVASSMGAGGKVDPTRIQVGDLFDTSICPLARHMRGRAKRRGVGRGVLTVFSTEPPAPPLPPEPVSYGRPRAVNGTVSYMPPLFGLTLAGEVTRRLLGKAPASR
ncbi:MAG: tRNA threonylcarbamoyladenosine dehydratase [Alphaproteobacteria bacterium CG_4_10_14_0_2_um_filter_63_37]|nr:MAG: tRNA threonylcarbamoyladenosine dehydratase [Proteobacteria bacterium CG1_02_64_396]PJA23836.1 MAG: tRNA threonylcarbamoyladenosine dehydratase [Alphaproteobacteria bacterium CG_4_10_14_0_2_um_filter_63_37]